MSKFTNNAWDVGFVAIWTLAGLSMLVAIVSVGYAWVRR